MAWLLALSALLAQQEAPDSAPPAAAPTRQQVDPVLGNYSIFRDGHRLDCTFQLAADSPGYVSGGTVTAHNCEPLYFRGVTRWEKNGAGGFRFFGAGSLSLGEVVDESKDLVFKTPVVGPGMAVPMLTVRRLDAPNLRRPMRLAVGWWTISTPSSPETTCRLELRIDGTIGEGRACQGGGTASRFVRYADGRWTANEGSVTLKAHKRDMGSIRFVGSTGKNYLAVAESLVRMVHD